VCSESLTSFSDCCCHYAVCSESLTSFSDCCCHDAVCSESLTSFSDCYCHYAELGKAQASSTNFVNTSILNFIKIWQTVLVAVTGTLSEGHVHELLFLTA